MVQDNKIEILNYLSELGCCKNCCLRYLCDKSLDFCELGPYLEKNNLLQWFSNQSEDSDIQCKKSKSNSCIVCLGLLQEFSIDSILSHEDLKAIEQYDTKVFTCSISMPASMLIREHSIRIHLEDKYPEFFSDDNQEIPLNRVWKMYVKKYFESHTNKTFENSEICSFSINVIMGYEENEQELKVLQDMQPKMFEERKQQHRKYNGELFSRKGALEALSKTSSGTLNMYAKVPPEIPSKMLFCQSIQCKHDPIYIAGRYCKFSRELCQTPWIIDGVKTMETSVQEIIFDSLSKLFNIPEKNLIFSSSGREDCDVRCIGKGRPFYIEILDPKRTIYSFQEFRDLEDHANNSKIIKVTDLQNVKRSDLVKIKEGEEMKTKNYTALCVLKMPVNDEHIKKLNSAGALTIEQKTPIRVLHRRPVAIRKKKIHEIKAETVPDHPNLFILHVKTQAGTYVKEFVHGDFKRTKPSIGDIIGLEVDIVALDVTSIDLDWPKPVEYL